MTRIFKTSRIQRQKSRKTFKNLNQKRDVVELLAKNFRKKIKDKKFEYKNFCTGSSLGLTWIWKSIKQFLKKVQSAVDAILSQPGKNDNSNTWRCLRTPTFLYYLVTRIITWGLWSCRNVSTGAWCVWPLEPSILVRSTFDVSSATSFQHRCSDEASRTA